MPPRPSHRSNRALAAVGLVAALALVVEAVAPRPRTGRRHRRRPHRPDRGPGARRQPRPADPEPRTQWAGLAPGGRPPRLGPLRAGRQRARGHRQRRSARHADRRTRRARGTPFASFASGQAEAEQELERVEAILQARALERYVHFGDDGLAALTTIRRPQPTRAGPTTSPSVSTRSSSAPARNFSTRWRGTRTISRLPKRDSWRSSSAQQSTWTRHVDALALREDLAGEVAAATSAVRAGATGLSSSRFRLLGGRPRRLPQCRGPARRQLAVVRRTLVDDRRGGPASRAATDRSVDGRCRLRDDPPAPSSGSRSTEGPA